jgi:Tfp pilus assembly protein PilF
MLPNNHVFLLTAVFAVSLLAGGCASSVPRDPATIAAPGQTMTLDEAARLTGEAEQLLFDRHLEQASALYARVVKAYPNNAQAWFRLGIIYLRGEQFQYAQQAFQQTLRADPRLTKAHANLALAHLHQFRAAAAQAVASPQVHSENRKALASLMRDIDNAVVPGGASAAVSQ